MQRNRTTLSLGVFPNYEYKYWQAYYKWLGFASPLAERLKIPTISVAIPYVWCLHYCFQDSGISISREDAAEPQQPFVGV